MNEKYYFPVSKHMKIWLWCAKVTCFYARSNWI